MNEPETLDLFASAPSVTSTQIIARNVQEKTVKTQVRDITQESVDVSEPVKVIHPKENEPRSSRRKGPEKSDDAFKTISEVASQMNVPQHVLRFWETKFSQIKPMKRGGGRRYYRPRDVEIIKRIQYLLHHEGYTIKGVQKLARKLSLAEFLNENSHKTDIEGQPTSSSKKTNTGEPLVAILEGLKAIRQELNAD